MTYVEFLHRLRKADLSVREFAEMVKMCPNSVTNCSQRGKVPSHLAVIVTLIDELAEHGLDFRAPLSEITIVSKKPRGAAAKGKFGGSRQNLLF